MSNPTAEIIERVGLIPVLRARNAAQAHAVVQAMIAGGVTVVEVTMTVPGAIDLLKELKKEYGSKILLGSGTVTTASEAYERTSFGQYLSSSSVLAKTSAQMMRPLTATTTPTALRSRSCLIRL